MVTMRRAVLAADGFGGNTHLAPLQQRRPGQEDSCKTDYGVFAVGFSRLICAATSLGKATRRPNSL